MKPLIFDSHAHYDAPAFNSCREKLLSSLPESGVCGVVTCGCDGESSRAAIALAEKYSYIYAAVGIHPENLDSKTTIEEIQELSSNPKCVAIGEIGLDYYWNNKNKSEQIKIFEAQLELANCLQIPVIIHDREAHCDTLELLKKYRPAGVVHCFSGSLEMASELIALGMYIGFGGVITFKNARKLPDIVKLLPEDRMLIETDCPYLAPEPFRGAVCNSAMIIHTAQKIAELRGCLAENILKQTKENAERLFGIKQEQI